MENEVEVGMNRTGIGMSPIDSRALTEYAQARGPDPASPGNGLCAERGAYALEAEALGTVPPPATVRGVVSTALDKIKGTAPEVLIDKLGERLAYERSGARLYEALLCKFEALGSGVGVAPEMLLELREFRDAEEHHFKLVADALVTLGADPTAQTPCADACGVVASGPLKLITDPRSNVPQCLEALLTIELTDNAAWELLIRLSESTGHTSLAESFRSALIEEERHLASVQRWVHQAVLGQAG